MRRLFLILVLSTTIYRVYITCFATTIFCESQELVSKHSLLSFDDFKKNVTDKVERLLPSPHSELLLGMTIGIDNLSRVPGFKKMLRQTGTIHVVVVSGFNISLVFNLIIKILGSPYKKRNLVIALSFTLFYSILSGFDPPVLRAWIMGSLISLGKYYGRLLDAMPVLIWSGLLMVLVVPSYISSISFHLSFLATAGLILLSSRLEGVLKYKGLLGEDFYATLAAQLMVWPYLSYVFGDLSLVGILVNVLVLWTVPITTVLGFILIFIIYALPILAPYFADILFVYLDFFTQVVIIFSKFKYASVDFELSLIWILVYYFSLFYFYKKTKPCLLSSSY